MKKIALVVEGKGDVKSVPSLVAKTAAAFGAHVIPCDPPIRGGEALKLKRPGELERLTYLAATREDASEVLVVVDLEDGCAKEFAEDFNTRVRPISESTGKPIKICFLVREYETLFLDDIAGLREKMPELGIANDASIASPIGIRGAKEAFGANCGGRGYRQTRDQLAITKKLNVHRLGMVNRSFRKLIKCVANRDYAEIDEMCEAAMTNVR
jgi:hypothetical protein